MVPKTIIFIFLLTAISFASCKAECECYQGGEEGMATLVTARFPSKKRLKEDCKASNENLKEHGGYCTFTK